MLKMGPSFLVSLPMPSQAPRYPARIYCKTTEAKSTTKKLPPGPMKLPLRGNLHNLVGALPHHKLRQLADEHGPLMHIQLGEVLAVIVSSRRMAQEVMKTQDHVFAQKPEVLFAKIMLYDSTNISFSNGEYWKQMRRVCVNELLGAKRVRSFSNIRQDEVSKLVEYIRETAGTTMDLTSKVLKMTNTIVARAAFGNKCKDQDAIVALAKEGAKLSTGFGLADVYPSIEFFHVVSGMKPKLIKMHEELDRIMDDIISEHKKKLNSKTEEEEDLVDIFLNLHESGSLECPITTNNIKAVLWDVFAAGTDTSSSIVEWVMSELMKNPNIMQKAQAEVRQALKGKTHIDETDVQDLKYLKMVIKETLRLHPPAPLLIPREAKETVEIDGYEIPAKTKIIINVWAIARNPKYWEKAETFIPERFLDSAVDFKGFNYEFTPFGAGRRTCPGMNFGLANIEYPISRVLYHFNWRLPDGTTPETLDMTECFGITVGKQEHLCLVATPVNV